MGKLSDNKLEKKNKLFDTAFHLFTTKGVEATSISDITKAANVGKGTFYLYFKNKQELEARLISHRASNLFRHAQEKLQSYPDSISIEDKVVILVNDLIDQLCETPSLLKFIYKNLSWGIFRNALQFAAADPDSESYFSFDAIFDKYKDTFTEPDLMIYSIVELASSTCYNVILWSDPVNLDVYRLFLDKYIRAIMESHKKK